MISSFQVQGIQAIYCCCISEAYCVCHSCC